MDCTLAPLTPYVPDAAVPWDAAAVQHLHQRLGYGVAPPTLALALSQNPADYVTAGLRAAAALPPLPEPAWGRYALSEYGSSDEIADDIRAWRSAWLNDLRDQPWRSKLVLFWHDHFVAGLSGYQCPSWMWQYHDLLQRYAFGDLRELVRAVGTTPAMLVYLNGVQSSRFEPNENYARELFELFTLGEGNGYTQADISEAARALTGYNGYTEACAPIGYVEALHDPGVKTVFGQSGNFDYDDVVDLIFTQRGVECSTYICSRLYAHFVSPSVDEDVVAQLATTLRDADWRLSAVYEELFSSAHFFSPALRGTRIKDPLEFLLGAEQLLGTAALRTTEYTEAIVFVAGDMGQILFDPPDVAGWPGDRAWINANRLAARYESAENFVALVYLGDRLQLTDWAKSLGVADETDVAAVARAIVEFVLPKGLPEAADYEQAELALRGEVPSYYFESGLWSLDFEYAPEQVAQLLIYLMRRPGFNLC